MAVIGGSGFYSLLDQPEEVWPSTPYGDPSGPITVGEMEGSPVAFLPRHGSHHQWAPQAINYRANLWALREIGVRRVIAPSAAGSLHPDLHPGTFVVLDQLVDRTSGRRDTYLDGPTVEHVSFADPYCPELSATLVGAAEDTGVAVWPTGTVVVINGPRFSTRAESRFYRSAGWNVINMTQYPEAYLARELGLCYGGLALVTDYDTGADDGQGDAVTMEAVMAVLSENVVRTRRLLGLAIRALSPDRGCACATGGAPSLAR